MTAELIRSRRRTLSVQVRRDGSVLVRAPMRTPQREIRRFLEKHADWIEKQQLRLRQQAEEAAKIPPLSEDELKELTRLARKDLTARCEAYAAQMGVSYGRIAIRHQKSKWGSCSSKGNLNFNCLLMLTPEDVRDYVVVHELCHLRHMNHSAEFWAEAEKYMPDYRDARKWLKQNGAAVMNRSPIR